MKSHIFHSICLVAISIFLASLVIIMCVLYGYLSDTQEKQLETQTLLAVSGVEQNGLEYLSDLQNGDYRITWIASDGTVLFDNRVQTDTMNNHLEREEIKEALKNGVGTSKRNSDTLTERQLYRAVKLSDGSVLRLSVSHLTWWALILGMLQPLVLIIIAAIVLALVLAYRLSGYIMKPLNDFDPDMPDKSKCYEELSPIIRRIQAQQNEIKRKQEELNRKKEEFNTATGHMKEGIVLLNETGAVLSINPSASKILGVSSFCIGKDLLLFNNSPEIQKLLGKAYAGERAEIATQIGSFIYQVNATPIVSEEKVSGIALILFDITEKERAETARREFTANVSHELKTPLQNISGYAELLSNGMVRTDDIQKFSGRIYSESKRMITLIDDIIKLSHLDEGGMNGQMQTVDLYELAILTHKNLLPVAETNNITFKLNGGSAIIRCIPELISEIMFNLCDNAIKYNVDGGSVTLGIAKDGEKAVVSVKDTGIGIPVEEQERIFERFYRVDKSHSKEVGGTGLGLSIVKHAALIHGAKTEVFSKPGDGTEIRLTFSAGENT